MKENTFSSFWEKLLGTLSEILPNLVAGLLILLIGFIVGKVVQKIVRKLILRLNENMQMNFRERSFNVDLRASAKIISVSFFWIIFSAAILSCIHVLKFDLLNELFDQAILFLPNIIAAIIIVLAGVFFGRLFSSMLQPVAMQSGISKRNFIGVGVHYFIVLIAIVIASDQLGIHIKFLTDVIDIILGMLLFGAALAFGLGARTAVSNIFGSYYAKQDHQIGSRIRYGEKTGTIAKISSHSIHLETEEGRTIIPAKQFNETEVTIISEEDE